jgi:hypothetical protein
MIKGTANSCKNVKIVYVKAQQSHHGGTLGRGHLMRTILMRWQALGVTAAGQAPQRQLTRDSSTNVTLQPYSCIESLQLPAIPRVLLRIICSLHA